MNKQVADPAAALTESRWIRAMGNRRTTLRVRIPIYRGPRNAWRRRILQTAIRERDRRHVSYSSKDALEVLVRLYLKGRAVEIHDIDNRVKDVLDALQGRLGGPKAKRPTRRIIENDRQIWRLVIEKRHPPKRSIEQGHLVLRKRRD